MPPPSWDNYSPDPTPDREPADRRSRQRPTPPRGPAPTPRPPRTSRLGMAISAAAVLGVLGLVTVISIAGNDDSNRLLAGDGDGGDAQEVAAQAADGFADLLDDLREENGHTTVFEAVIYPEYASVDVPYDIDDPTDERSLGYYWDGDLDAPSKSTESYERFDLSEVDPSGFATMCEAARAQIEDPTGCYLIIRAPEPDGDGGWISAYSSNEFGKGGYVEYDLDGNETYRTDW